MNELLKKADHFHINADSTQLDSYLEVMGKEKAKMLFADPPYCLLVRRNKKTGQLRDPKMAKVNHEAVTRYENVKEYRAFTEKWMSCACQFIEDDGVFVIWTNFLGKEPIKQTAKKLGLKFFHGEFLWGKLPKQSSGNETLVRIYEVALVFSKKDPSLKKESSIIPWSVITQYDEEGEASDWENHPNHKPFSSLELLIRSYTEAGDRILDPFTGSGSTPSAAIKLNRKISGIELREHWAQVSQERILKTLKEVT